MAFPSVEALHTIPVTFPTVEALHTIPSYASETAAWPLQNLRTLRTLAAASTGLSTAAWPLVEAFDEAWLQLLIGLSFQLAFPAVEAMHAIPSYLRFRDCRLAPSKPPYPLDPSLQRPLHGLSSCLATGRGFRRGLAAAVIPVGLSSCGGHAHNSFLRFRDFKTSVFFGSLAAVHYLCFSSP